MLVRCFALLSFNRVTGGGRSFFCFVLFCSFFIMEARANFCREEINNTVWEVPEKYTRLKQVGTGAYGSVWWVNDGLLEVVCGGDVRDSGCVRETVLFTMSLAVSATGCVQSMVGLVDLYPAHHRAVSVDDTDSYSNSSQLGTLHHPG